MKILRYSLLAFLGLLIISYFIFRTASVQTWLITKIADKLSKDLQTEVSIEGVDISWFMNVVLQNITIKDHHKNDFFKAKELISRFSSFQRKRNKFVLSNLEINDLYLAMRYYKGEKDVNFQFIIDHFASTDTTSSKPSIFGINKIIIRNGRYILDDENEKKYPNGIDYYHLDVSNINASVRDFRIDTGYFFANFKSFSIKETSGFQIKNMVGDVILGSDRLTINDLYFLTPNSEINSQFEFKYNHWGDWLDFINKINFNTQLDSSKINIADIKYFAPDLKGMNDVFSASGNIIGSIANLKLKNLKFDYGKITHFDGKISLAGLPDIEKSFIDIKVNKFITNSNDINSILLPNKETIPLPDNIKSLQNININGRFTGFYNDFVANAKFNTAIGSLETDILLKPLKDSNSLAYNGKIDLKNFDLGKFIGGVNIGNLSLNGEINGQGLTKDAVAEINLDVSNIRIAKYTYRHSSVVGNIKNREISAKVISQDSLFHLVAAGSYNFAYKLPIYKFDAKIANARLDRLFMSNADSFGTISGHLIVDAQGNSIDNIRGNIDADSIIYLYNDKLYQGGNITIASSNQGVNRDISIDSKYIDGKINGEFNFKDLTKVYTYLLDNFIPSLLNGEKYKPQKVQKDLDIVGNQFFKFNFNLKNTKDLSEIFYPDLMISDHSNLNGLFNAKKHLLDIKLKVPEISYVGKKFKSVSSVISGHLDTFNILVRASKFVINDSLKFDSLQLISRVFRDSADISFSIGKSGDSTKRAIIKSGVHFLGSENIQASITQLDVFIEDSLWRLKQHNNIIYKHHYLNVSDLRLVSGLNSLNIDGIISDSPTDLMKLSFNDFELSFLNFFLRGYQTNLQGRVTGYVDLSKLWDHPNFTSNFKVENLNFNESYLGDLSIKALWNDKLQAVGLNVDILNNKLSIPMNTVSVDGYYFPYSKEQNLDLEIITSNFPLRSIQPYLSSFSSKIEGTASGNLKLDGTLEAPLISGFLKTNINALKVDYLNTEYSINDNFVFKPNYFGFEHAKIHDSQYSSGKSHSGDLTFKMYHKNFADMRMELSVDAENINLLNTTKVDNELFYGYGVGDAKITIDGPLTDLKFDIYVKPLRNSKIAIPMSESSSVQTTEFISFIVKDTTLKAAPKKTDEEYNMSLKLEFDMTPEATVQLVMDETVGDIITANGAGNIRMTIDRLMNVNMYGTYEITKGDYLFTMRNIINKHFYLKPGGSIRWNGDVMNAKMNLQAVYRTEAKLYDLLRMVDTSSVYKRRSKVDCVININGNLVSPDIAFNIELPEESSTTKELVNMVLFASSGETNQDIMNKNFISLLMLGTFQAPSGYSNATNPNSIASNATEMLANQVSNWLSKMSNDVDIGVSYVPGDDVTSQEFAVSMSYQAFNDRLLIDGKFGSGGDMKDQNSTRVVGDFDMEYKITKNGNLKAKAFNRTNYDEPFLKKAPYTQGVGIVYRKEFDNLRELFEKTNKLESQK